MLGAWPRSLSIHCIPLAIALVEIGSQVPATWNLGPTHPVPTISNNRLVYHLNLYPQTGVQKKYLMHKSTENREEKTTPVKVVLKTSKKTVTTNTLPTVWWQRNHSEAWVVDANTSEFYIHDFGV